VNPIFLIVGPPAVGKSTASRALAAQFQRSIHIPVDDLRDMVVSGRVLPSATWGDELILQIRLARESAIRTALAYSEAGFTVVIDDFVDPYLLVEYQGLQSHAQLRRLILYPDQSEAHRRNLKRSGLALERSYIDDGIRIVYQLLRSAIGQLGRDGWEILDTSALTVEATVSQILCPAPGGANS
jgi:AAA domain